MPRTRACVALLLTTLTAACAGPEITLELKQNIHHDDFEYSAQRIDKLDRIGDLRPAGVFYVVTFQVDNRAKRVDHEWDNALAFIVDEHGHQYENDPRAQAQLAATQPFGYRDRYVTSPGAIETTKFVFDLPRQAAEPYLRVRGETLMGDVLDGRRFTRTRIKLF